MGFFQNLNTETAVSRQEEDGAGGTDWVHTNRELAFQALS